MLMVSTGESGIWPIAGSAEGEVREGRRHQQTYSKPSLWMLQAGRKKRKPEGKRTNGGHVLHLRFMGQKVYSSMKRKQCG